MPACNSKLFLLLQLLLLLVFFNTSSADIETDPEHQNAQTLESNDLIQGVQNTEKSDFWGQDLKGVKKFEEIGEQLSASKENNETNKNIQFENSNTVNSSTIVLSGNDTKELVKGNSIDNKSNLFFDVIIALIFIFYLLPAFFRWLERVLFLRKSYAKVRQHRETLLRKRKDGTFKNVYGIFDDRKWRAELDYFMEYVIDWKGVDIESSNDLYNKIVKYIYNSTKYY